MAQTIQLGKVHTSILTDKDFIKVIYHNTEIVKFNNNKIILDTGGWFMYTTKLRMNQASNQFNLYYRVFSKLNDWFVKYNNKLYKFNSSTVILNRK